MLWEWLCVPEVNSYGNVSCCCFPRVMVLTCEKRDLLSERQLFQDLFNVNISHFCHLQRA